MSKKKRYRKGTDRRTVRESNAFAIVGLSKYNPATPFTGFLPLKVCVVIVILRKEDFVDGRISASED